MSLPQISAVFHILASIAMEEIELSHIINIEGEKIQHILSTLENFGLADTPTINEVLHINQSVKETLRQVAFNQMILSAKMTDVLKAYANNETKKLNLDSGGVEPQVFEGGY